MIPHFLEHSVHESYCTPTFFFAPSFLRDDIMSIEFKNNVAIAVSLAILLWKDATPSTPFPKIVELVKIELGRILSHRHVLAEIPWLQQRLSPLQHDLSSEPWNVDPPVLIDNYIALLTNPMELELVGQMIRDISHADPAFDMIRRQGRRPSATAESMILTARGVAKALDIDVSETIENGLRQRYRALYSQLY